MFVRVMKFQLIDDQSGRIVEEIDDFLMVEATDVEAERAWRAAQSGARSILD